MSTPDPLPPQCSCNYGYDRTGKIEMSDGYATESTAFCCANLQPNDPTDPSKGYLQCQDITKEKCDDSVDGLLGITCQYDCEKCALSSAPRKGSLKCVDPGPDTPVNSRDCKLRGMSGSDCRGCLGDGAGYEDDKGNFVPKPIAMPSSFTNTCGATPSR